MFKRLARLALASALCVASLAHAQDISFGIIATDATAVQKDKWLPFLADMKKATGLNINAYFAPDYNGVIEAMRFNKVQVAWFGNKSAMEAVDRANGEVFSKVVFADGTEGYYSLLITHRDSPIRTIDDVLSQPRQWSLGNGDPNSTSGNLVPGYYLWGQNRIDVGTHFKAVRAGSHGNNILAVLNRQVDVATNNTEELERLKARQPDKAAELRVLWRSPLIPSDPFVWRRDLPADAKERIRTFVLNYGKTDEEKAVLKNIYNYKGFVASTDAQLLPIRQLELFKDRLKVLQSEALDDASRRQKVAEIDARLAEIGRQIK